MSNEPQIKCCVNAPVAEMLPEVEPDLAIVVTPPDFSQACETPEVMQSVAGTPIIPGNLNGPWYIYPGTTRRHITIYVDPSAHGVRITGAHTFWDCLADGLLHYSRVCPVVFVLVGSPSNAAIRVYGRPLGHPDLAGGHGSARANGNVFVSTTFTGGKPWAVYHGVIIPQHEIGHVLITMGHVSHRCLMNGAGNFLPFRFHGSNALLASLGLAGFSSWAIGQLQSRFAGPPALWRAD